ncbi:MAG: thiol peroxidase [Veillonellaceae bacterium]|nr:thiol peroxidase [Veillonellaceae bacterium]
MKSKREKATVWDGRELTLVGPQLTVGEAAPDFVAVRNDLSEVHLHDYEGKIKVISVVPSVDTPVCNAQTRRFNTEAAKLGEHVVILTLSMDLPFAQERFCAAAGIEQVETLSDYRYADFGSKYGFLIEELHLLARGMVVVDEENAIRHIEYVRDADDEVDFAAALEAVRALL